MTEQRGYTHHEQEIYDAGFAAGASAALERTHNMLKDVDSEFEKRAGESLVDWRDRFVAMIERLRNLD